MSAPLPASPLLPPPPRGAAGESDTQLALALPSLADERPGARSTEATPFHLAEFDLGASPAELTPEPCEGHAELLQAFEDQQFLIKTVTNDGWVNLIQRLQGQRFRTPLSLPPPGGRGMRFFGQVSGFSVGLVWHRQKIDLTEAFIWPSGYFAKSEFNVDPDGTMKNGRQKELVTPDQVMRTNEALEYWHHGLGMLVTGEVLPYNECLTYVEGALGVSAIFARSTSVTHLLWAMGVRALLSRTLPAAGELPIFVHDPEQGMRPFGRSAQRRLVSEFLETVRPPSGNTLPFLPIDSNSLGLSKQEQLELHGRYGLTDEALAAVVTSLLAEQGPDDQDTLRDSNGGDADTVCVAVQRVGDHQAQATGTCADKARSILALGLTAAVHADNSASATSLIRHLAPQLLLASKGQAYGPACGLQTCSSLVPRRGPADCSDFVARLHALAREACSPDTLAPVGAMVALDDFASGRMLPRILDSCKRLESWLQQANSLAFRMQSWHELNGQKSKGDAPALSSFVTQKAIKNRRRFYDDLIELKTSHDSGDVLHGMNKLNSLIGQLQHPCMRLEILQYILGLDERFDLQTMNAVANLAYAVIADAVKLGFATPEEKLPEPSTGAGCASLFRPKAVRSVGCSNVSSLLRALFASSSAAPRV